MMTCNQKNYVILHITSLLFDERIADMVEKNKKNFPDSLSKNIYDAGTFKLSQDRLDRILTAGFDTNIPPINVKKTLNGMYKVIDGRHRICAIIMRGGTTVPSVVVCD
jgi:hypothetical protein